MLQINEHENMLDKLKEFSPTVQRAALRSRRLPGDGIPMVVPQPHD